MLDLWLVYQLSTYCILLIHPETLNKTCYHKSIPQIVDYLLSCFKYVVWIYPCSDHGYSDIVKYMDLYSDNPFVLIHKNIDAHLFRSLCSTSSLFIGNSSAGIIETSAYPIPTVNIGDRQQGRLRPDHVIDCTWDINDCINAIQTAISIDMSEVSNPYWKAVETN